MYDYTGTLLYSAKNHNCRKDGKLKYFKCIEYVHNLDVLTGEFKIIFR